MATSEVFKISGMNCMNCVNHVSKAIKAVDGVQQVLVSLEKGEASVTYITNDKATEDIKKAVQAAGYNLA